MITFEKFGVWNFIHQKRFHTVNLTPVQVRAHTHTHTRTPIERRENRNSHTRKDLEFLLKVVLTLCTVKLQYLSRWNRIRNWCMQCTPKKLGHRWSETEKAKRETFVGRVLTRAVEKLHISLGNSSENFNLSVLAAFSKKKKSIFGQI